MRRFIALVLCIALCFGLLAMPSYALDATHIYTACGFWSFLNRSIFSGIYDVANALWGLGSDYYGGGRSTSYNGGGRPDADLQTAYNSYVSDLNATLGTTCLTDSGIRIYAAPSGQYKSLNDPGTPIFSASVPFTHGNISISACSGFNPIQIVGYSSPATNIILICNSISVPFQATYSNGLYSVRDNCTVKKFTQYYSSGSCDANYSFIPDIRIDPSSTGNFSANIRYYWDFIPYTGVVSDYYSGVDITASSRAPSILTSIMQTNTTNNAYYIGTKDTSGAVTNVYTTNIFNEEIKVFTVPGETPVEHTVTNWNYDYSTRTYNCTDGTNNYVVTYGDDHITITVPDGSGGTTSTDYYYVHQTPVPTPPVPGSDTTFPDSSSDNYEDDPNTTGGFFSTVWKAFKEGLSSLIAGIIKGLFKGIKALIDGITSVFSGLVSGFFGFVSSFFNSFGTGPGAVGEFFGGGVVDLD